MAHVIVREARLPEERPSIDRIHDAAFEDCCRPLLGPEAVAWFDPAGTCFVAEELATGTLCGFIYVCYAEDVDTSGVPDAAEPPTPRVDDLFVHPAFQNSGVGSKLLARAEAFAAPETLHLAVLMKDARARRFYSKHGWSEGERVRCDADGGHYILSSKRCEVQVSAPQQPVCGADTCTADVTMPVGMAEATDGSQLCSARVLMYARVTCGLCWLCKWHLWRNGIDYDVRGIDTDRSWCHDLQANGFPGGSFTLPVVVHGDKAWWSVASFQQLVTDLKARGGGMSRSK